MNKQPINVQTEKLISYAKAMMLPGDELVFNNDLDTIRIVCQQEPGYDLRLFVWFNNEPVRLYTYYSEAALNGWKDETRFFNDSWGGI